jgi:hypothetical protein
MPRTVRGTIHGKTIQLTEDLDLVEGQQVEVVVHPLPIAQQWGEGIARSAGAAADVPGFDEAFQEIQRGRRLL